MSRSRAWAGLALDKPAEQPGPCVALLGQAPGLRSGPCVALLGPGPRTAQCTIMQESVEVWLYCDYSVTAFMMQTDQLTFEKAYRILQTIKPEAKMNEGFEWQLKLYQAVGYDVDPSNVIYKQYPLQKVTEKFLLSLSTFFFLLYFSL